MAKTKKANLTPEQKIVQKQLKKGVAPLADYIAEHVEDFEKPEYQAALSQEVKKDPGAFKLLPENLERTLRSRENADILLFNAGISPFDGQKPAQVAKFVARNQNYLNPARYEAMVKTFTKKEGFEQGLEVEENDRNVVLFNANPTKYLAGKEPKAVAAFFHENHGKLDFVKVGEVLGDPDQQKLQILKEFTSQMGEDFEDKSIDEALRIYTERFRVPGESQKIDRIMDSFGEVFITHNQNIEGVLGDSKGESVSAAATFTLALNTSLHNPNVKDKDKFTKESFAKIARDSIQKAISDVIYENIQKTQLNPLAVTNTPLRSLADKVRGEEERRNYQLAYDKAVLEYMDRNPELSAEALRKKIEHEREKPYDNEAVKDQFMDTLQKREFLVAPEIYMTGDFVPEIPYEAMQAKEHEIAKAQMATKVQEKKAEVLKQAQIDSHRVKAFNEGKITQVLSTFVQTPGLQTARPESKKPERQQLAEFLARNFEYLDTSKFKNLEHNPNLQESELKKAFQAEGLEKSEAQNMANVVMFNTTGQAPQGLALEDLVAANAKKLDRHQLLKASNSQLGTAEQDIGFTAKKYKVEEVVRNRLISAPTQTSSYVDAAQIQLLWKMNYQQAYKEAILEYMDRNPAVSTEELRAQIENAREGVGKNQVAKDQFMKTLEETGRSPIADFTPEIPHAAMQAKEQALKVSKTETKQKYSQVLRELQGTRQSSKRPISKEDITHYVTPNDAANNMDSLQVYDKSQVQDIQTNPIVTPAPQEVLDAIAKAKQKQPEPASEKEAKFTKMKKLKEVAKKIGKGMRGAMGRRRSAKITPIGSQKSKGSNLQA